MDENVKTFLDVTACGDIDAAKKYLELANNNLEKSLDLFFDPTIDINAANSQSQVDLDAALAQQIAMQDEANLPEAAPDYMETLIQQNYVQQDDTREFRSFGADLDDDPRGLRQLFAPPPYKFEGTIDQAMAFAQETRKLLMASLNVSCDFRSHQLNRDIWKKESITDSITSFFVFYQAEVKPGASLCNLYQITELPCLLIIDPRTGRNLREIPYDDIQTLAEAMSSIMDVVHDYPLSKFYPEDCRTPPDKSQPSEAAPTLAPSAPRPATMTPEPKEAEENKKEMPMEGGKTLGSEGTVTEESRTVHAAHAQANNTLASLHAERMKRRQQNQ